MCHGIFSMLIRKASCDIIIMIKHMVDFGWCKKKNLVRKHLKNCVITSEKSAFRTYPAGTSLQNDVAVTSMQGHYVASTSVDVTDVMCLLVTHKVVSDQLERT